VKPYAIIAHTTVGMLFSEQIGDSLALFRFVELKRPVSLRATAFRPKPLCGRT
jgi:hypothetical protein